MQQRDNPCLVCSLDQKCCNAEGLKLTRREFDQHFGQFLHRLSIVKYGEIFIAYPRDGLPCPHWGSDGCAIYEDRPIDCRLFPFELRKVSKKRNIILIEFNDQTDCPQKEDLFIPVEEAKELMRKFAQEAYGRDKPIHFKYVPGERPRRLFGVFNPFIARIYNYLRAYR